jgi:molybdopterin converting factor small subunit
MRIVFSSNSKLRDLMGAACIRMEMPPETRVVDVLENVAERYGAEARALILGERSGVLVLVNDEMIEQSTIAVSHGDEITVLLPIAGG